MKKKPTKEEKEYMNKVAQLNCVACQRFPVEVHHKTGAGMALRSSHFQTISLCYNHHRGQEGIHTIGKKTWEAKYGTQQELIEKTRRMLDE